MASSSGSATQPRLSTLTYIPTADSIRSGYPDSCFPHLPLGSSLTTSMKLKEIMLAAYTELDRIDWKLGDTVDESDLQRLFAIDDTNSAVADCIVTKLTSWAKRKDAPLQFDRGYGEDEIKNKTLAQFAKDKDFEEHMQIRELAPFCEQLSTKMHILFQKAALAPYQSQLKPPIKDLRSLVPVEARGMWYWLPARITAPLPKLLESSETVQQLPPPSSSSTPASQITSSSTVTARIAVAYDAKEGDKLYVRSSLDWSKSVEMELKEGMWVFETTEPFEQLQYKIVLNDTQYEKGCNRITLLGEDEVISSPRF